MSLLGRRALPGLATRARLPARPTIASASAIFNINNNHHRNTNKTVIGRRNLSIWNDSVGVAMHGFQWIHGLGIPWFITIPLAAAGLNLVLRLPLAIYSRQIANKQIELLPFISGWRMRHFERDMRRREKHDSDPQLHLPHRFSEVIELKTLAAQRDLDRSRRRVYKTFGVQRYKLFLSLFTIFPFAAISEALRRLAGAEWQSLFNRLGGGAPASSMDQSLIDGGCLWFTDLTAQDPTWALPVMCSAVLLYNVTRGWTLEKATALLGAGPVDGTASVPDRAGRFFSRLALVSVCFPLLFAHLPAGVMLYWFSSFCLSTANQIVVERLHPAKKVPRKPFKMTPHLKWMPLKRPKLPRS